MGKEFISRGGHRYDGTPFRFKGRSRDVYRRGTGPAVILIHEAGGLNQTTFDIADRLVDEGFRVLLPLIVGQPRNDDGTKMSAGVNLARLCISWQVHVFLTGRTSPVVKWLRALAADEKGDHPGVGIIGMCFSGGFAIGAATTEPIVAAIASQPALPWPLLPGAASDLGLSHDDVVCMRDRYSEGKFGVFATRYRKDKKSSKPRIDRYKEEFGDNVVLEPLGDEHSVLARAIRTAKPPHHPDPEAVPSLARTIKLLKTRLLPNGPGSDDPIAQAPVS